MKLKRQLQSSTRKCHSCKYLFPDSNFYTADDSYCKRCRIKYNKLNNYVKTFHKYLIHWEKLEQNDMFRNILGMCDFQDFATVKPYDIPVTLYSLFAKFNKPEQHLAIAAFHFNYVFPHISHLNILDEKTQAKMRDFKKNIFSFNYWGMDLILLTTITTSSILGPSAKGLATCKLGTMPKWITYEKKCQVCGTIKPTYTLEDLFPASLTNFPDSFRSFVYRLANGSRSNPSGIRLLGFSPSQWSNDGWKKMCRQCDDTKQNLEN